MVWLVHAHTKQKNSHPVLTFALSLDKDEGTNYVGRDRENAIRIDTDRVDTRRVCTHAFAHGADVEPAAIPAIPHELVTGRRAH